MTMIDEKNAEVTAIFPTGIDGRQAQIGVQKYDKGYSVLSGKVKRAGACILQVHERPDKRGCRCRWKSGT
mgnify:CR=1 FL=1